jgi:hypothetical protein
MANEIQISASLAVSRSGATFTGVGSSTITQAGTPSIANTQVIDNVTTEALLIGDVTAVGYLFVKNLDASNYVELSLATPVLPAAAFVTLLPGECALIPTRLEVIYAKANSAPVNLLVVAASL